MSQESPIHNCLESIMQAVYDTLFIEQQDSFEYASTFEIIEEYTESSNITTFKALVIQKMSNFIDQSDYIILESAEIFLSEESLKYKSLVEAGKNMLSELSQFLEVTSPKKPITIEAEESNDETFSDEEFFVEEKPKKSYWEKELEKTKHNIERRIKKLN